MSYSIILLYIINVGYFNTVICYYPCWLFYVFQLFCYVLWINIVGLIKSTDFIVFFRWRFDSIRSLRSKYFIIVVRINSWRGVIHSIIAKLLFLVVIPVKKYIMILIVVKISCQIFLFWFIRHTLVVHIKRYFTPKNFHSLFYFKN